MTEARKQALQTELDSLTVHQETLVGWDEHTPPNETLDQYGNLLASNRGVVPVPDNRSPSVGCTMIPGLRDYGRVYASTTEFAASKSAIRARSRAPPGFSVETVSWWCVTCSMRSS